MIYGVTLGGKHTYRDWGLLPKTRPTIAPPKVRTNYVDVPGLDGALDLSEALTGRVGYQTRDFSAEFIVIDARNRWTRSIPKYWTPCTGSGCKSSSMKTPATPTPGA